MATNQELQQEIEVLKRELAEVKNYTSNLGGSLEFRKIVQEYVLGSGGSLTIGGALKHTGTTVGFFNASPVAQQTSIADPTGGSVIDVECRAKLALLLSAIDNLGLTA